MSVYCSDLGPRTWAMSFCMDDLISERNGGETLPIVKGTVLLPRAESCPFTEVTWRWGGYDLTSSKSRNTWTRSATQYLDSLRELQKLLGRSGEAERRPAWYMHTDRFDCGCGPGNVCVQ